ncbi:MAG: hypothetical protein PHQ75_08330 [Thermoguttaceae bacterium]|nr:hypothetical protein [Thermoguttaceae bacterium]
MKPIELVEIKVKEIQGEIRMKVAGQSPGILQGDLEEMMRRISSVLIPPPARMNIMYIYYHHLPSNASVIGRMVPVRSSQKASNLRSTACVQCLVVPPEALADFGNNPVLLYQTLLSNGGFAAFSTQASVLKPITSWKKASPFDEDLIHGLMAAQGRHALMVLLESILNSIETSFTGRTVNLYVLSGLYNLLPMAWRRELTFTMGLMFREDWGFRAIGIAPEDKLVIEFYKKRNLPFFDLDAITFNEAYPITCSWVRLVNQILQDDQYSYFVPRLLKADFHLKDTGEDTIPTPEAINRLGDELLADYAQFCTGATSADTSFSVNGLEENKSEDSLQIRTDKPQDTTDPALLESELPYPGHSPSMLPLELPLLQYESGNKIFSPYQRLIAMAPEYKDWFQQLDSLVGHVLRYDQAAVEALRRYWKDIHTQFDDRTLWVIREEYIHYVQASLAGDDSSNVDPARRSIFILEVLGILVN